LFSGDVADKQTITNLQNYKHLNKHTPPAVACMDGTEKDEEIKNA